MLRTEAKKTPTTRKRDQRRREYEHKRREAERRRAEEQAKVAKVYSEKQEAAKHAKQQRAEEEAKAKKERDRNERRILREGRKEYEERIARERHEAYLERCRKFEEDQARKRKEYSEQRGQTWADRQKERHDERFQSRYRRFVGTVPKQHNQQEGGSPGSRSSSRGAGASPSREKVQDVEVESDANDEGGDDEEVQEVPTGEESAAGHAKPAEVVFEKQAASLPRAGNQAAGREESDTATWETRAWDSELYFWERRRQELLSNFSMFMNSPTHSFQANLVSRV
mmetsp:Transcript_13397/g.26973  ORF Transcript_13397/g.26973 Transcript_13397/m.26973 type:complete len:283 (-) Transcript_13397:92-940(-)